MGKRLLLLALLCLGGCTTEPDTTVVVLVCVTDWEHGTSECHHRRCDVDPETGALDCFNKPVLD